MVVVPIGCGGSTAATAHAGVTAVELVFLLACWCCLFRSWCYCCWCGHRCHFVVIAAAAAVATVYKCGTVCCCKGRRCRMLFNNDIDPEVKAHLPYQMGGS